MILNPANLTIGVLIILINIIPLLTKKYKYFILTSMLSLLLIILLKITQ